MDRKIKLDLYNSASFKPVPSTLLRKDIQFPLGKLEFWLEEECEMLSFQYTKEWLDFKGRYAITPRLPLRSAAYIKPASHIDFSIFRDYEENSCWQSLIKTKYIDRPEKNFNLLNSIITRSKLTNYNYYEPKKRGTFSIGDLFFYKEEKCLPPDEITCNNSPFVDNSPLRGNFPLNDESSVMDNLKSININKKNIYEGTIVNMCALGGQRAKNTFIDGAGNICIAKLPFTKDGSCVKREFYIFEMAKAFGINTAFHIAKKDTSNYNGKTNLVLLTRRFDRELLLYPQNKPAYRELPFATATSLLGNRYEDKINARNIYLELAEFIYEEGDPVDLEELWKRMIFSICINNRDDNLYNHGFLRRNHKWRLSPMFGVKFSRDCYLSESPISLNSEELKLKLDLAINLASYFRVIDSNAEIHIKELVKIISEYNQKYLMNVDAMNTKEIEILEAYANKLKIKASYIKAANSPKTLKPNTVAKGDKNRGKDGKFKKKD